MNLAFIGMSNIGKSFWARQLAAGSGWTRMDCDGMIEARLAPELTAGGFHGVQGLGKWMGLPHQPDFKAKGEIYLAHERAVMRQVLDEARNSKTPTVIDTTGSVIYTGAAILADLRNIARVIYLQASDTHIDDLFRRYIAHPKPTLWDTHYMPQTGETSRETLQNCYPHLLHDRAKRYKEIAHVTIPYDIHHNHRADLAAIIKTELEKI